MHTETSEDIKVYSQEIVNKDQKFGWKNKL